jgi:hypothetical protein
MNKVPFAAAASGPLACSPLLKFHAGEEIPHLCEEGLARLAALPPPVSLVSFLGDGRCGKSTLASGLVAVGTAKCDSRRKTETGMPTNYFPVGDTGVPVTEGIDICIIQADSHAVVGQDDERNLSGTLAILDCEGGDNPTAAARSAVDVVAMLGSTLIVQVVWGALGEGQLRQLGQGLAARDRLLTGGAGRALPGQRLLLVANGCHLRYAEDHLAASLSESHGVNETARNELRANIKRAYEQIHFVTVPHASDPAHTERLSELRQGVTQHCLPATLSGSQLSGAQVAELMRCAVAQLQSAGVVPVQSIFRHVLLDHLLLPLARRIADGMDSTLPDLSDGEYRTSPADPRIAAMERFDKEVQNLTHTELVAEAKLQLRTRIDRSWLHFCDCNNAIGEQDRDVSTEFDTRFSHTQEKIVRYKRPCIVVGKKQPVVQPCSVFRVWTRTRVLKKNGQLAYSEWQPGSTTELDDLGGASNDDVSSCGRTCSSARTTATFTRATPASPVHSLRRDCSRESPR